MTGNRTIAAPLGLALAMALATLASHAYADRPQEVSPDGGAATSPHAPRAPLAPSSAAKPQTTVDVRGDSAQMRFSFPVKVPAWFLWQHATDCQAYLRSIKEVKRCEYFTEGGKPAVFLEAEIFGRRYGVVIGIHREFRRGHGKVEFESKNLEAPAKGSLRVDTEGEGVSRLSFDASMPRDPSVPTLLWRMAVHAAVTASTAQVRSDLESAYAAVKDKREAPTDLVLKKGGASPARPPAGPPVTSPLIPSPPVQAPRP